ncbi:hypothetical protein KR093_000658 [Drosophila rubida]|uniref:aralkylamine N-acetyltransferase n=1 Tax=Drosophila rubida TaxID=30044 RepID=A0AAD4PM57_9MUSC|nr:hypothetical protein KR093_000658 [Drosophila rubida]
MGSTSADGVVIRDMKVEDYVEVKKLLLDSFYTAEPLSMCMQKTQQVGHSKRHDDLQIAMIEEGSCIVAVDEHNANCIVGIIMACNQGPSDDAENRERAKTAGPIFKFLTAIETEANIFERYKVSEAIYLHIVCVANNMRGKGLGTRLTSALMKKAREKGLPLLVAECTSFYAARQMEAMGMECAYSLAYADYKNEQGEVVFQPMQPHTHVNVMVKRL